MTLTAIGENRKVPALLGRQACTFLWTWLWAEGLPGAPRKPADPAPAGTAESCI